MKKAILVLLALIIVSAGCESNQIKNSSKAGSSIPGTWQTASMTVAEDGTSTSEYYVQFTDSEIIYGHMKDEKFVPDHSDQISLLEKTETGGYKIQAVSSNGVQYTYQTSESNADVLNYFETWQEEEYPDKYSGGASLIKCQ